MDIDPNMLMIAIIVTNLLWVFVVFNVRKMIGPKHFDSAFKAVTKRIKHPARFHKFYKSQYLESEFQDTTMAPRFYENYTIPLTLDEGKRYNGEGPVKEYIVLEGALTNSDPMQKEQPFFNALLRLGETNNKMRDIEEARLRKKYATELVTVQQFKIGVIIILVAIVIVIAMLYPMTEVVTNFKSAYDTYKPAIDQAIANLPRIEVN